MQIAETPVEQLNPAEYNPRTMSDEDRASLERSISTFGFVEPIVANKDGTVIGGHQRLAAAKKLGRPTVPVYFVDLPKDQEKALNIALNRITGEFDMAKLPALIAELPQGLQEATGFSADEISAMLDKVQLGEATEDEAPPVPQEAKTKPGDLYQLGTHRLLCGDATIAEHVERLMGGEQADMVFTDPPYNADYSSRVDKTRRKPWGGILNDNMSPEAFDEFLTDVNSMLWANLKDGGSVYECIDWKRYPQMQRVFADAFDHKAMIVWNKNYFGLGTYYRTKFEIICFGVKGASLKTWNADHDEMDVWDEDRAKVAEYQHPTQKPVSLCARAIQNSSLRGELVLDLFGGSGSTLIAAEQTGRRCYMTELDPKYCDVIVARWEKLTGQTATLLPHA